MAELPPREKIVAMAGEMFLKRGYGAVTMDEIIDACGIPKATMYQYFPTKLQLGSYWLERLTRRMGALHRSFLDKPGDRNRRLRKYFFAMLSWTENNGFRACQFANAAACPGKEADGAEDILLLVDQYKRTQHNFFIELVATLVPQRDARRLGTAVFLLYSGAMTEAQNLKATWPFEDALACAEELCGAGVNHP